MPGVALLFPTGTDPRSPYLALPCLAASLRRAGVEVRMHDLDVGGLHFLLQPPGMRAAGAKLRSFREAALDANLELRRLADLSEGLEFRAPQALDTLRDPARFFNPNEFNSARETIYDALDLISAATGGRVRYSISPVRYDVAGVDIQKLADVLAITRDHSVNLFARYWEEAVYPALAEQQPEIVGITITNAQQVIPGLTLARRLKERGYFVVIGGTLYTKFVDTLRTSAAFFEAFADAVVPYEGETAFLALYDSLTSSGDLSKVPNLLYLNRGAVHHGPTHVEDVESLPCPDFDGLPLAQYLTPQLVLPTYFGKGCYFNRCKFCDIPYINHISQKAYRMRSVERIVADLLELKRRHGCRHFEFTDEALPPRSLEHLAEALEPYESEQFRFVGYARLESAFTGDVCARLARAGFRKFYFGLESACQETLDHMDKGIRMSDVPAVLANCAAAGIHYHLFAIVGFPEETEARARQTFEFFRDYRDLIEHPGNSFDIHPFGLELRTSYFHEADRNGALIPPEALSREFVIGVSDWTNTRGLSAEQVEALLNEFCLELRRIYNRYHAAPQHLWPAFEEFAVLYAGHYEGIPFRFQTALPDESDPHLYRLSWNPAASIQPFKDEFALVRSRTGELVMDLKTFHRIAAPEFRTIPALLDNLASSVPDLQGPAARSFVRDTIDSFLQRGLLQMEPLGTAAPRGAVF